MPKKEAKSKKEIETTLAGIEKTFGKGSVMLMKDDVQDYEEGIIPTGSIILDMALGIGGLPKGRIVEIFGAESAGVLTELARDMSAGRFFRVRVTLGPTGVRSMSALAAPSSQSSAKTGW